MPSYRFRLLYSPFPPQLKSLANEIRPLLSEKWITLSTGKNPYAEDSVACFVDNYSLNNDLSDGQHYPAFQQLGLEQ